MRRFWNRARLAPWTFSAHLTAWGILFILAGHSVAAGLLLFLVGVGGCAFVLRDYCKRTTGHQSDVRAILALLRGELPTLANLVGLATHLPQGVIGGWLLRQGL